MESISPFLSTPKLPSSSGALTATDSSIQSRKVKEVTLVESERLLLSYREGDGNASDAEGTLGVRIQL